MLNKKLLGTTDLMVSELGFGCAALGSRTNSRDSARAVAMAIESGINFFDTAPVYGQGESERILGKVVRSSREKVVIATKIGIYPGTAMRLAARVKPLIRSTLSRIPFGTQRLLQKSMQGFMRGGAAVNFDPNMIIKSVESSLTRLQTDVIDLLQLHTTPPEEMIDDVIERLITLSRQGKIRFFGASSHDSHSTTLWLNKANSRVKSLQVMLNIMDTNSVAKIAQQAQSNGIAIIAREPFAQGRLLPPRPSTEKGLGFIGEDYDNRFEALAKSLKCSVPDLALRYLAACPGITVVIAGMTTIQHLKANVSALDESRLSEQSLEAIRLLSHHPH